VKNFASAIVANSLFDVFLLSKYSTCYFYTIIQNLPNSQYLHSSPVDLLIYQSIIVIEIFLQKVTYECWARWWHLTWTLHLFMAKCIIFTDYQAIVKKTSQNIVAKVSQDKRGAERDLKKNLCSLADTR
jgi:hypothetical protein